MENHGNELKGAKKFRVIKRSIIWIVLTLGIGFGLYHGLRLYLILSMMNEMQAEAKNAITITIPILDKNVYILSWKKELNGDKAIYRVISLNQESTESPLMDCICKKGFYPIYYKVDKNELHIYSKDSFSMPTVFDERIHLVFHNYGFPDENENLKILMRENTILLLPE